MSEKVVDINEFRRIKEMYLKTIQDPNSTNEEIIRAKSALPVVEEHIQRYRN